MPALLRPGSALECRPCSRPGSSHSTIRSERAAAPARVAALRAELKRRGLDGFIVPRADRQQNEYLPASEERLAWLTGFTGSAGAAIVLAERAALFVDGRYTVQAAAQIDAEDFFHRASGRTTRRSNGSSRISRAAPSSATIPGCTRPRMPTSCARPAPTAGAELVAVDDNPIDALWTDRPAPPAGPVSVARPQARRRERRRQTQAHPAPSSASCAPMCWWCPIRRTSPGRSISAAPTWRIRRWRLPSRLIPREGRPALYVDGGQARQQQCATRWRRFADGARAG